MPPGRGWRANRVPGKSEELIMKAKFPGYWAAFAVAVIGVICLAVGLAAPVVPCRIQDIGPEVCADPGASWTYVGDALLILAAVTFAATFAVRRLRRRGI